MVFWSSVPPWPIPCTWNEIPYRSVPYFKCSTCFNKMRCRDMFQLQSYVSLTPLPLPTCKRPSCSGSWPSCTCCILQAKQTERLGGEISLTHSCATPNRLQIASKPIFCISQSALSWFLDGLERRQIDLLRFTSDKGPDLSTEGRNHLEASKPRSAELAAVASSSCSKQNSFTLSVVRAESMRKQFISFQIHFYRPPCLQNSAPNPKKKVLSVLMKGTLAEMMSNYWTFWISVLRMTSGDCKKTKVLLRKACDWIPVNSKDIRRPAHLPWKTMENCAWSVWIHWSCYGAVAPGLSISSACWIMLQQLHLWSLYTCHMYVYICFNLL